MKTARRSVLSRVIGRLRIRPGGTSGASCVHHLPDVADLQIMPRLDRSRFYGFEIWTFIDADLSGNDCPHATDHSKLNVRKLR